MNYSFRVFDDIDPTFVITLCREFEFFLIKQGQEKSTIKVSGVGKCKILLHEQQWGFTDTYGWNLEDLFIAGEIVVVDKIFGIEFEGAGLTVKEVPNPHLPLSSPLLENLMIPKSSI